MRGVHIQTLGKIDIHTPYGGFLSIRIPFYQYLGNIKRMELFILLPFLLLGILFFLFRSARYKGYVGERKVSSKIESLIGRNKDYRSFHDMTLKTPDGTTQIDHILISPYGIFVIETKNLKGWLFGSADQKKWTQTLYGKKYKFQNPLHQNYKHIKAVQKLLNADIKTIISVVVFVGDSEFKTVMPYNVVELRDFLPHLRSYTQQILSGESIEKYSQLLMNSVFVNADKKPPKDAVALPFSSLPKLG